MEGIERERGEGGREGREGEREGRICVCVCVPEIDSFLLPYIIHYTNNL